MTALTNQITPYIESRVRLHQMDRLAASDARYTLVGFATIHGNRPIAVLGVATVEAWLGSIGHLAPATRRNYLSRVRKFCGWLVDRGYLRSNPAEKVERIRQPRPAVRAMRRADVARLLAAAPDDRALAILWLMVGCGLRCVEISRLGVGDFDPGNLTLKAIGKGHHERIIPVPTDVARALERYMRAGRYTGGPLIRSYSHPSRAMAAKTISTYVRKWMRAAGVKSRPYDGTSAHALRHTCATDVYLQCKDIAVVKEVLGHANIATTSRYVRAADLGRMREAMEGRDYRQAA